MQVHPSGTDSNVSIFRRLGIFTGFLAAAVTLPFLSKHGTDETPMPKPDYIPPGKNLVFDSEEFKAIQTLRRLPKGSDLRQQEKQWVEKTYPFIRKKLISLYQAEKEDIRALNEGRITEKDRKVKICLTDFVGPGEEGDDMSIGPNLHIVKYYDEVQPNGAKHRIYVNELWPEANGILFPESIRVRAQMFDGSLFKEGAHNLFVTDMFQLFWNTNDDNSKPGATFVYPQMARQHYYGDFDLQKKTNRLIQSEFFVTSPTSCIGCHTPSTKNNHTKHLFHQDLSMKINYSGAITLDKDFELPYNQQPGFKKYIAWLNEKVKKGEIKNEFVDNVAKSLMNSRNLENPYLLEVLRDNDPIPWLDDDGEAIGYEAGRDGFTYTDANNKVLERAIYTHYGPNSIGLGRWWFRNNLRAIP